MSRIDEIIKNHTDGTVLHIGYCDCCTHYRDEVHDLIAEVRELRGERDQAIAGLPPTKTHELKIRREFFEPVVEGRKTFEVRRNDRDFAEGDALRLREIGAKGGYTGRECMAGVTYLMPGTGAFGLDQGFCILGIALTEGEDHDDHE